MQRVASVLKIRPGEARLVLLVGFLALCLQAGQGFGDNTAAALFFLRYGVDFLPFMYVLLGASTFVLTLGYTAALGHFQRSRFFQSLLLGLTALVLVERLALSAPFRLLYPILWLTISCVGMILGTFLWNLAGEVSDARQAKRLFPLFASAGILGSVVGNSLTGLGAKLIGTENLLVLYAGLLVVSLVLTRSIASSYLRPAARSGRSSSLLHDLRSGFDFVRRSPLMQLAAYAAVLFSILFFSISFPFSRVVTSSFSDEAGVAGFLGLFTSITTTVTFLVSLFVANRVYGRLGIVNTILLLPLAYLLGFVVFASRYSLLGGAMARFVQMVVLAGLTSTAWNALFNVVPLQKRGQVLAFQNGVPSQIGVAISGILLILGNRVLTTSQVFLMGSIVTLVCGWLVWRMRAAYGQALVQALRAGRLEVFSASDVGFAGMRGDPAALRVVTQALHEPKAVTRRVAAEILAQMQDAASIPSLVTLLSDPSSTVRAAVVRALGRLHATTELDGILGALDDPEAEVRLEALAALTLIGAKPTADVAAKLDRLLQDDSLGVRIQALRNLARSGEKQKCSRLLMTWIVSEDPALRAEALDACADIVPLIDGNLDMAPVVASLRAPQLEVRVAACRALASVDDAESTRELVACLHDRQPAVRRAAASALCARGGGARNMVLEVFDSEDTSAWDAALDALSPGDQAASDRLRHFIRNQITSLHSLRSQGVSLPDGGPALAFLRFSLGRQLRLGEERVVRSLGLIGDADAMEFVRRGLSGSKPETRAAALEALETLGDKILKREILSLLEEEPARTDPVTAIQGILQNASRWDRVLAIRSVRELGLTVLGPRLAGLQSDPDALVSETAQEALRQLDEVKSMQTLQTLSTVERVLLLREVPIFSDLSPEDLEQIAEIAQEQWYPSGSPVCRQGEEGDMLYIIADGRLEVVRSTNGQDHILAERGPGDFVGEMAIIDAAPRSASVITRSDARVLALDAEAFKSILTERPEVSLAVLRSLSRRLREMSL